MRISTAPKVSVVMAVLRTRFLNEAIESALDQDYPNLEVIVIDDGSTEEEMPGLLAGFAERNPERFRFESQENQGQARSINRGMELAEGEFAGYLSDDDLLLPGAMSRLVGLLIEDPEAVVAYPAYTIIDEDDQVLDTITPTEYSTVDSVRLHDSVVGAGAFYRTDAFRRIGGWNTDLRYRGDYDCWLRLSLLGGMRRISEPLAAFRLHGKGRTISDAGVVMARESLEVLDDFFERDDLPEAVRAVRGEAYRNAFIGAAMVLSLGQSDPGERFYVYDRHMPEISRRVRIGGTLARCAAERRRGQAGRRGQGSARAARPARRADRLPLPALVVARAPEAHPTRAEAAGETPRRKVLPGRSAERST